MYNGKIKLILLATSVTKKLDHNNDCVCIENLNMKAMTQALNFGKSVTDNRWGIFVTFLQYKLAEMGKQFVKVNKFFANSQICSVYGYKNTDMKNLSIRAWDCPKCGTHHNRDVNAAINKYKKRGDAISNCIINNTELWDTQE